MIAVGDVDEVVPSLAGLSDFLVGANGLHEHAGGVGGDAEGGGERLLLRRVHHRRAAGGAGILDPPAHGAAIDGAAIAREAVLDAEQRHALAVLEHDDVREQRRRRERTREGLGRHRRGVDRRLAVGAA